MVSQNSLNFFSKYIKIPKLGKVKFSHDKLQKWYFDKIKLCNITIEKTPSNKYFAVLLYEIKKQNFIIKNRKDSIGLDFSPENFYVNSDNKTGKDFGYVAWKQEYAKKLKRLQRRFAKKKLLKQENSPQKISSKNREKVRIKLARLEEKIANKRRDFIEKESLRLVRNYDKIVIEDLNLKGISSFLRNAKNMNDTAWGIFVTRLLQKSEDYNCKIVKADRFFPSRQLCSCCGFQNSNLKLSDRTWTCPSCKTYHIRDVNAAINLKNYIPQELREFKSVENKRIRKLAKLAMQSGTFYEAERNTGN